VKVVLFCGGLGLRAREGRDDTPKPMITIGYRPILWHVMKYYAHFGHRDFILCLGHRAGVVKDYFLHYDETVSNDFVLSLGGKSVELLGHDIEDWRITFVDTGLHATVGQRLRAVEGYIGDDEMFLANYGDALTDAPLPDMIERLSSREKIAMLLCVRPQQSFHLVTTTDGELVETVRSIKASDMWINGGYFVFRRDVFCYLNEGEDLVEEPFRRLAAEDQLLAYPYEGFWQAMDTLKDRYTLERLYGEGTPPWAVWEQGAAEDGTGNHGRPGVR
jgi:glucose-1-phosphate cytidylyltransferase